MQKYILKSQTIDAFQWFIKDGQTPHPDIKTGKTSYNHTYYYYLNDESEKIRLSDKSYIICRNGKIVDGFTEEDFKRWYQKAPESP